MMLMLRYNQFIRISNVKKLHTFKAFQLVLRILPSQASYCLTIPTRSYFRQKLIQDRLVDNLNNVRREASKHFRNKEKEYLKAKIDGLEINSKTKNIRDIYRGINDIKMG
jgi:hypothetical protein